MSDTIPVSSAPSLGHPLTRRSSGTGGVRVGRPCVAGLAIATALVVLSATSAAQGTLMVDAGGGGGSYTTIQSAIDASVSGDTILVAPGSYLEQIDFLGKDVAVLASGAGGAAAHVIDGQGLPGSGPVVTFVSGEGPGAVLDGFTITGGVGGVPSSSGGFSGGGVGGVLITNFASPTVRNCHIVGNVGGTASGSVGGVLVEYGVPTIESCDFWDNIGTSAPASPGGEDDGPGALRILGQGTVVSGCTFTDNVGGGSGPGGIKIGYDVSQFYFTNFFHAADIRDCVFQGNVGGAVHVFAPTDSFNFWPGPSTITRCLMTANSGPTIHVGGGMNFVWNYQLLEVTQCTLVGNSGGPAISHPLGVIFSGYPALLSVDGCVVVGHDPGTSVYGWDNGVLSGGHSSWAVPVSNSIFWDNLGAVSSPPSAPIQDSYAIDRSCVQGGFVGVGNIDADPLFVQAPSAGLDGLWGTADDDLGDLRLAAGSPCVDAGDSASVPLSGVVDAGGLMRFHDDPSVVDSGVPGGWGGATVVDMGAHEFASVPFVPGLWNDLGQALGGGWQGYEPQLVGVGALVGSEPTTLHWEFLSGTSGAAYLVVGLSPLGAPFKQGVLVPSADLIVPLATQQWFSFNWLPGLPSGVELFYQCWIQDSISAAGFAASNGLSSTTP